MCGEHMEKCMSIKAGMLCICESARENVQDKRREYSVEMEEHGKIDMYP